MNPKKSDKKNIGRWILFILLIFLLIISFYPIIWMFMGSFKTVTEIYQEPLAFPTHFDFNVYREAWIAATFTTALFNSITITTISVMLILVFSSLSAYAFAVMDFRFKNFFYTYILVGQVISAQIILIPMFSLFRSLHILNTKWSVIFAYTAIGISLSMLLLRNSFQEIPKDIYDSAKIDGCGSFHYYLRFMLPLSKPGIASVIIYQALFAWNEYLFALTFLSANDQKTLPLTLTVFAGRYSSDWPKIFAILSLSIIPILVLYLFLQKYFIKGLTAGAVKG